MAAVAGDEDDGGSGRLQGLQQGGTPSPKNGGGLGLGGAGAAGMIRRGSLASSIFGMAARGLPGRAAASTCLWRVWEYLRVLKEAGGGGIYRRVARRVRALPEDTYPRRPVMNGARERGRR